MAFSGFLDLQDFGKIAKGLNIEGKRPSETLPPNCKWYNLVQVIDEPLKGETFEAVMAKVKDNSYPYIEQAVGIEIEPFLAQLTLLIKRIKHYHRNLLVHVHQYTGTTILAKVLEKRTGVPCILDETNFGESPINYREKYPTIDGLLSLSQCAGFDLEPGTWIVPTSYLDFDVPDRLIYADHKYALNEIKKYLSFPYVRGNLLTVNALWNPELETDSGYLVLDSKGKKVLDFVKENTKNFDVSHNWKHALQVAFNATKILNTPEVLYLALVHDVSDHKYPESLPREVLSNWIKDNLTDEIDLWIDQVSFSKQVATGKKVYPGQKIVIGDKSLDIVHPVLEAVRDGDRMEAIGEIGLQRCIEYTQQAMAKEKEKYKDDPGYLKFFLPLHERVMHHCRQKLGRLVPEGYIVNVDEEVIRRHNVIMEYFQKHIGGKYRMLKLEGFQEWRLKEV